ncbi:DUF2690 domain-containing protein [Kitasatospora sp. NPDC058046]|uniref:DUF2690 domain-containing protein n=1 Tax=Kitasatospora sp. NPDC058046 TaxID=3346312 RepID=UPI0036DC95D1
MSRLTSSGSRALLTRTVRGARGFVASRSVWPRMGGVASLAEAQVVQVEQAGGGGSSPPAANCHQNCAGCVQSRNSGYEFRDPLHWENVVKAKSLLVPLAVLPLLCLATPAQAAQRANPYAGKSPYAVIGGRTCASDSKTKETAEIVRGDGVYGIVYLRQNSRCSTLWAFVNFGAKLHANEFGNAYIQRLYPPNNTIVTFNCDTANGNGHVRAGQVTCYTPMMNNDDYLYRAEGALYHKNSAGKWVQYAFGKTRWI